MDGYSALVSSAASMTDCAMREGGRGGIIEVVAVEGVEEEEMTEVKAGSANQQRAWPGR